MKRSIAYRKSGEAITVLIPESKQDIAELQKLYDAGKLQPGDNPPRASAKEVAS